MGRGRTRQRSRSAIQMESIPRTPQSLVRRASRSVSRGLRNSKVARAIGGSARALFPYAAAAVPYAGMAYRAGQMVRSGYKAVKKIRKSRGTQTGVSGRSYGASNSKSAGRFTSGAVRTGKMDKYLNQGCIIHREHGDVVTDSSKDVVYIAHSTCPKRTMLRTGLGSLVKYLFKKAGLKIKNWESPLLVGANIPARLEIEFKVHDGDKLDKIAFPINTAASLADIVSDMTNWINSFTSTNFPQQFLRITYYHDIGTFGSSRLLAYDIDLTSTSMNFGCFSHLKIQNRTINSSGNDQADDVDNVPLYGRSYDVKYNGTTYRDYNTPSVNGAPQLRTDIDFGTMDYSSVPQIDVGSNLYKEVAQPKQLAGLIGSGKAHLDPGEIKTSTLYFETTIGLNKLVSLYKNKGLDAGVVFWLGKTRIFGFEKMINAVAMNETNQFNLAFEHDLKIGCVTTCRENHQTAMKTENYTGKI